MSAPLELNDNQIQSLADSSRKLDEWRAEGRTLAQSGDDHQWQIGDWLIRGEEKHGRTVYREAAEIFRMSKHQTLKQYVRVARRFPEGVTRLHAVPWTHYQIAARLTPQQQQEALAESAKSQLTKEEFRKAVNSKYSPTKKPHTRHPGNKIIVKIALSSSDADGVELMSKANAGNINSVIEHLVSVGLRTPEAKGWLEKAKAMLAEVPAEGVAA